jgi:hypothetical protein
MVLISAQAFSAEMKEIEQWDSAQEKLELLQEK